MSDIAIKVEGLSKEYRLGQRERYKSLRDVLSNPFKRAPKAETIWALKDVSFEIKRGEVVGVIGRNGAGKSTLLKILSQITEPTTGTAEIHGRVGSLLEVGTGFHPELTGRENIFLNGAILGMRKAEITGKFDEIVAFAEVEKFIDTPVKHYSSGMQMRLAFAVAAHLEPEILLVDEVLAVGDAAFQERCLGKMESVARAGRTVIFVSHNLNAISVLTRRCLLLANGEVACDGATSQAIGAYAATHKTGPAVFVGQPSLTEPRVVQVEVRTSEANAVQINGQPMEVIVDLHTPIPLTNAAVSFQACNEVQQPVLHLWLFDSDKPFARAPGLYRLRCQIPNLRLYMGRYTLTVHFSHGPKIVGICPFEVTMYHQKRDMDWIPGACTYLEDSMWEVTANQRESR